MANTDIAIVVAGSADSGKSSMIGVLTSGELDNGNGLARAKIARHPHEIKSGKTSSIATKSITYNNKTVSLIDLCGQEKYLKTTTYGITGHFPDYAFVIIAANRGVLPMTKEHMGILFYMQIPMIILITRIDIAPDHIYQNTIKTIKAICKAFIKTPVFINSNAEVSYDNDKYNDKLNADNIIMHDIVRKLKTTADIIPIITISNKTGYYFDIVRNSLPLFEPRRLWTTTNMSETVFYIDSVFNPTGVGVVISGIVKGKTIKSGDTLYLGPYANIFIPVRIRSLHNNCKQPVTELSDHQRGCLAIASTDKKQDIHRSMIAHGMCAVWPHDITNNICYRFVSEIEILHHSSTIKQKYSPVIHMGPIRQSARITSIEKIISRKMVESNDNDDMTLRTGDKAAVTFKFMYRPEFVETGMVFFFREGRTRGCGKVISTIPIQHDNDPKPDNFKIKTRNKQT